MSTVKPNAALAYAVLDQIDAHPETWNQGTWDCGTAACFAGWAVRLSGGRPDPNSDEPEIVDGPVELIGLDIDKAAEKVLGACPWTPSTIDLGEDDWLFSAGNDRAELGRLVAEIFGPRPVNGWDDSIGAPAPCQPIGCDNGYHLHGCTYAEADAGGAA